MRPSIGNDDKDIRLILCSRGGYGVVHILDKLNFTKIKKYPKWLVGYSDITALHLAFLRKGLTSLHGPMARHLAENSMDESSLLLKQILFTGNQKYVIEPHKLNITGNAKGILFGGNLAVLCGLIGTTYMKVPENGILFIEDIAESPYKIDRMMWQLKLSGILKKISGLIVGEFTECEEDPLMGTTIYESISDIIREYNYPVMFDFPVGHGAKNYPLIHGSTVNLIVNSNNVILENIK